MDTVVKNCIICGVEFDYLIGTDSPSVCEKCEEYYGKEQMSLDDWKAKVEEDNQMGRRAKSNY